MQSPEVWTFKEPDSSFQTQETDINFLLKNIQRFSFNHLVSIILPDCLTAPQNLINELSNDSEYYKITNLNLADLLNFAFLQSFVKRGNFSALSVGTRIDCDTCVAITPSGQLVLSSFKDTYQSLGIEGKVSHFSKKNKDRYIVSVDLKNPKLIPGKPIYERTLNALNSLGKFDLIFSWEPHEDSICPSSVAKYFHDLKYSANLCEPSFNTHIMYSIKTPTLEGTKVEDNDLVGFIEWLGMVSIEGDCGEDQEKYVNSYETPEPNSEMGPVRFLQWRGFFSAKQVAKLLSFVKENNTRKWIAIYTQGFSDAPLIEDNQENHYFTNADNGNIIVFIGSKIYYCKQRCSGKMYK